MKKKIIVLLILVCVLAACLTACNTKTYKQDAIAVEYADSPVENNGGLVVKQGKYVYFVNAYTGADADNAFGKQQKTCLMRATIGDDGAIIADSQVIIVPKNIYSASTKSGIYIYNNWIYYATPNTDKTKSGTANTTYLDFYRTSTDRSKTELLYTINSRSADFTVTENAIYVMASSNVYKIDLNKKNANKINNKDNYVSVLERASALTRIYADNTFGDYFFVLQSAVDTESYKGYNSLLALDKNGNATTVFGQGSFGANEYTVALLDYVVENDGLTIFYTKSHTDNAGATSKSLCAYKFADTTFAFDSSKEKQLIASYSGSAVKGISFADGAIVTSAASPYIQKVNEGIAESICGSSLTSAITVYSVSDGYIYYTASSSATAFYRFKIEKPSDGNDTRRAEKVCDITMLTSWISPDFVAGYMYYLDSATNYAFTVKMDKGQTSTVAGIMTAADKEDYEKDED